MTLEQLANLGDFIGGIVVIVTLVFLVFEIRSNTKSINLSASIAWKESYANLAASAASVPELAQALKKLSTNQELTIDDRYQLRLWTQQALIQTELGLLMVEKGQLDEKVFYAIWNPMKAFLVNPEAVKSYETLRDKQNHFGAEMRAFMDRQLTLSTNKLSNDDDPGV